MDLASELAERIEAKEFHAAKSLVNEGRTEPLAEVWPRLPLFERLIVFKLLTPENAWALFESLDSEFRFELFTAFDLGSIAPVLESLPEKERSLFVVLPEEFYERMSEALRP